MSLKIRNKSGFTLLEMVISMSVTTILLLGIAVLFPSIFKNYQKDMERSYAKIVANSVEEAIKNEISFAKSVISPNEDVLVYVGDYGQKTINGAENPPVIEGLSYDDQYYMNKTVALQFSVADEVCHLTVTVASEDRATQLYRSERDIRLYNPAAIQPLK